MSRSKVEEEAVGIVRSYINKCPLLKAYIDQNDKTPFWDGDIFVYNQDKNTKVDFVGRLPLQVKGRTQKKIGVKEISFEIIREDIEGYRKDGGIFFFCVQISGEENRIFCRYLSLDDLTDILDRTEDDKNPKVKLMAIHDDKSEFQSLVLKNVKRNYNFFLIHDELQLKNLHERTKNLRDNFNNLNNSLPADYNDLLDKYDFEQDSLYQKMFEFTHICVSDVNEHDRIQNQSTIDSYINHARSFLYNREREWHDQLINQTIDLLDKFQNEQLPITDIISLFNFLYFFIKYLSDQNQYHLINRYYEWELSLAEKITSQDKYKKGYRVSALNHLAIYYCKIEEFSKAEELYNEALQIHRELDWKGTDEQKMGTAILSLNLGWMYWEKKISNINKTGVKYMNKAEDLFIRSLTLSSDLPENNPDYREHVALSLNNLSLVHLNNVEKNEKAREELNEAIEIFKNLPNANSEKIKSLIAGCYRNLGRAFYKIDNLIEAEKNYKLSVTMNQGLAKINPERHNEELSNAYYDLGLLYLKNSDSRARTCFKKAIDLVKDLIKSNPSKFKKYLKQAEQHRKESQNI